MLISEMFYSLQGEGALVGVPSVFIRTSGCNLRCRWCDTPYASWKPEGTDLSLTEIMRYVQQHPAWHVVVTGGEPMVAKGILDLFRALKAAGKHITIETAGTLSPEGVTCDLASISPKLAHSTPSVTDADEAWRKRHEAIRWQPDILRLWLCGPWQVQLKFVVATEVDVEEVRRCVAELNPAFPLNQVMLMPEGVNRETLRDRQSLIIHACKTYGFRYSPRLHIDLFGNKRGT
jgi:7-carboxy-7-deazaguanine synthase